MTTKRGRGALPKFDAKKAAKIRKAYGTPQGRGRRSDGGMTLQELAEVWDTSVSTIRAIVHRKGAYAVRPSAPGDRTAGSSVRASAPPQSI